MASKKTLVGLTVLVVLIVAAAFTVWILQRPKQAAEDIQVSGNIEVTDADVSFKISGRVDERRVDEGETVRKGDIVARLDTGDLEATIAMHRAEVQAADASLAELLAGSRPEEIAAAEAASEKAQRVLDEFLAGSRPQEIAEAEAELASARADEEDKEADFHRYENLAAKGSATGGELDRARSAYKVAVARVRVEEQHLKLVKEGPRKEQIEQARAALAQARAQYQLVKKGPRQETIDAARAKVAQAKAALLLAETQLGYATVRSPLSGVVLSKSIESGEFVAPGTPVVTVGDLENVWLRAYVNETDLGRVRVGLPARVMTDTYPGRAYEGRVSFLASQAEFTPKNVQTDKERVKLVYRVKIEIANPSMELKPGMPADAAIHIGSNR